jgi:hypothetical protein
MVCIDNMALVTRLSNIFSMEDFRLKLIIYKLPVKIVKNVPELMGSIFIYKNGNKQCITCHYYKTIFTIMIRKRA